MPEPRRSEERELVIVGGGPAGITTALALVHADPAFASRVLVLEKGRYPREKYCAGALGARGDKILARFDAVPDVPSARVDGISFHGGRGDAQAMVGSIGRVVRRIEFDHALARIAIERGIEVRDGAAVSSIAASEDGAIVQTAAGEIRARVVVGADGVGSVVRKAIDDSPGANGRRATGVRSLRAQVLEVDTEHVAGDPDRSLLHFDAADRRLAGYTWDFPTVVGGEKLVCRGIYKLKLEGDDSDIQSLFAERLARMGLDLGAYKNKRFAERGYDPADRAVSGPLMLVGEALGIDPVTGEGIAQAIEYGALAGVFLASALRREIPRVDGWSEVLARSRLSRDLRIRRAFVGLFYGPARPEIEAFVAGGEAPLHVGCQHFADQPYDWLKLGEVLGRGVGEWLGFNVRRLLG
jgi:flavin-dependent dehydrogenase